MFIPLPFLIAAVLLLAAHFAVDFCRFFRRRHHDHLLPATPRRARG